jgi:similar to stage IV sporulation protein
VLRALEECGVQEGTWWPGLSTDAVRSGMLLRLPELAWMTVNVSGSLARVTIVERMERPEIYQEADAADIVAAQAGIVSDMTVLNGHPLVSRGSAVLPGETLVTGAMDSLSHPTRYVRAAAEVYADTWYEWTAVEPLPATAEVQARKRYQRFALQYGKKRCILFGRSRKALDGYDKIVHEYNIGIQGLFALPIRLIREEYRVDDSCEAIATVETDREKRLEQKLSDRIDGTVLQVRTESFEKNGCLYTTLRAHCRENIARTVERNSP